MFRVYELYQTSEVLLQNNQVEIEATKKNVAFLKSNKALVKEELAEAKKQVGFLSSDLKEVREDLNEETLKLKALSKEQKVLVNTVKTLKAMPAKKW